MYSTLQCLSQTKSLTNYFLNDLNKERIINNNISLKNKNDDKLSPVYLDLIKILWKINGDKSYSPYLSMNKVNDMNPLFKTSEAGDTKDFIILEQLHKKLKKSINKKKPQNQQTLINMIRIMLLIISSMILLMNVQLYLMSFFGLLKQQMNVLIVKINLIHKDE